MSTELWSLRAQSAPRGSQGVRWEDTPPPLRTPWERTPSPPRTPWQQTPSPPRTSIQHHVQPSPRTKDLYQQLQSKEPLTDRQSHPRALDELGRQSRLGELSAHSNAAESTFMEALRQASRVRGEVLRATADVDSHVVAAVRNLNTEERIEAKIVLRGAYHHVSNLARVLAQLETAATQALRPLRVEAYGLRSLVTADIKSMHASLLEAQHQTSVDRERLAELRTLLLQQEEWLAQRDAQLRSQNDERASLEAELITAREQVRKEAARCRKFDDGMRALSRGVVERELGSERSEPRDRGQDTQIRDDDDPISRLRMRLESFERSERELAAKCERQSRELIERDENLASLQRELRMLEGAAQAEQQRNQQRNQQLTGEIETLKRMVAEATSSHGAVLEQLNAKVAECEQLRCAQESAQVISRELELSMTEKLAGEKLEAAAVKARLAQQKASSEAMEAQYLQTIERLRLAAREREAELEQSMAHQRREAEARADEMQRELAAQRHLASEQAAEFVQSLEQQRTQAEAREHELKRTMREALEGQTAEAHAALSQSRSALEVEIAELKRGLAQARELGAERASDLNASLARQKEQAEEWVSELKSALAAKGRSAEIAQSEFVEALEQQRVAASAREAAMQQQLDELAAAKRAEAQAHSLERQQQHLDTCDLEAKLEASEKAKGGLQAALVTAADRLRDLQREVGQMEAREQELLRRETAALQQLKDFEKQHESITNTWVDQMKAERIKNSKIATAHAQEVAKLQKTINYLRKELPGY